MKRLLIVILTMVSSLVYSNERFISIDEMNQIKTVFQEGLLVGTTDLEAGRLTRQCSRFIKHNEEDNSIEITYGGIGRSFLSRKKLSTSTKITKFRYRQGLKLLSITGKDDFDSTFFFRT